MDTMTTTITKGRDGWEALDLIDTGDGRQLRISTDKSVRGGLHTTAMSVVPAEGGGFTYMLFSDFSSTVATSAGRCTEKSVRELHAKAMQPQLLDPVVLAAVAFHAPKQEVPAEAADADEAALDDFNYVGSRHHY